MPQIPYQAKDLAEPAELVAAIRARRGGELLNLDRMLLHSPELASGWNSLLGAIRQRLALTPQLRELAMCAVAVLNRADYEFIHHAPEYIKAGGSQAQVDELRRFGSDNFNAGLFNAADNALLQLTLEMTRDVQTSPATIATLRAELGSDQLAVEAVSVIAAYNMVSRFLLALGVEPE